MVQALGALRILQSKKKLAVEKQWETHFSSNKGKENLIKDYVDGETTVARKRIVDTKTAIKHEKEVIQHAEKAGLTTRKPKTTFEQMLNTIGDSLSADASPDDGEAAENKDDDEEHAEQGNRWEHDEPSWVIGKISKAVQYWTEKFLQKEMKLDELQ